MEEWLFQREGIIWKMSKIIPVPQSIFRFVEHVVFLLVSVITKLSLLEGRRVFDTENNLSLLGTENLPLLQLAKRPAIFRRTTFSECSSLIWRTTTCNVIEEGKKVMNSLDWSQLDWRFRLQLLSCYLIFFPWRVSNWTEAAFEPWTFFCSLNRVHLLQHSCYSIYLVCQSRRWKRRCLPMLQAVENL